MNSEAAKNPVLDVRKELEALRDEFAYFEQEPDTSFPSDSYRRAKAMTNSLLQRIPEGWEMRPKDPNQAMLRVVPPGTGAYWRAMWDAAKAEAGDE